MRTYMRMEMERDSRKVVKRLLSDGWILHSVRGLHHKFLLPNGKTVIVPHPKKDLPLGTARNIAKFAGWLK